MWKQIFLLVSFGPVMCNAQDESSIGKDYHRDVSNRIRLSGEDGVKSGILKENRTKVADHLRSNMGEMVSACYVESSPGKLMVSFVLEKELDLIKVIQTGLPIMAKILKESDVNALIFTVYESESWIKTGIKTSEHSFGQLLFQSSMSFSATK